MVVESEGVGADGVADAAPLAQFLKEAGAGVAAEDDVEEVEGEAAVVLVAEGGEGHGELGLLDVAGFDADARVGGGGGGKLGGGFAAASERVEVTGDAGDHVVVADLTSSRDDGAGSVVVAGAVGEKFGAAHGFDGLGGSCERTAEGVVGPEGGVEEFLNVGRGFVAIHLDFLGDDAAFAFYVQLREAGIHINVAEDVADAGKIFGRSGGVVAGAFFGGVGVHVAADAFNFLHDAACGAAGCALEEHVLDEVGDAVEGSGLVASTDGGPDPHGCGLGVGHLAGGDPEATGEGGKFREIWHREEWARVWGGRREVKSGSSRCGARGATAGPRDELGWGCFFLAGFL